jgi:hypothetical protein
MILYSTIVGLAAGVAMILVAALFSKLVHREPRHAGMETEGQFSNGVNQGSGAKTSDPTNQCGLNVFPVSINVFRRERIRGQPSAQAAYVESPSAHSSCVTFT